MKKTIITLSSAFILSTGLFLHPVAHAEASLSKTEITQAETTLMNLTTQFTNFEQSILENESILSETNQELSKKQRELVVILKEIKKMQKSVEEQNTSSENTLHMVQINDETLSYVEAILGASTVENLKERVLAVLMTLESDQEELTKQVKEIQLITEKRITSEEWIQSLQDKKTKLEIFILETEQQKEIVAQQINEEKIKEETKTKVEKVVTAGNRYIGKSTYVFGGGRSASDIKKGRFDCSGFVIWAFKEAGVTLKGNTDTIKKAGKQVKQKEMQPGDIVFFDTYKKDGHVGIYVGDGNFIGSQSSTGIAVASLTSGYWKDAFKGKVVRVL